MRRRPAEGSILGRDVIRRRAFPFLLRCVLRSDVNC